MVRQKQSHKGHAGGMFDWLCPFPRNQAYSEEFLVGVKQKSRETLGFWYARSRATKDMPVACSTESVPSPKFEP